MSHVSFLQVSSNGVLSFRNPFPDYSPEPFPLEFDRVPYIEVLIAPFWDDTDYGVGGSVLYRFTTDPDILDEVGLNISNAFQVDFNPVMAFISTWEGLSEFLGASNVVSLIIYYVGLFCMYTSFTI